MYLKRGYIGHNNGILVRGGGADGTLCCVESKGLEVHVMLL